MADIQRILEQHGIDTAALKRVELRPEASIYALVVPNGDALTTWVALRELTDETGHWPILLGEEMWAREFLPVLFDGDASLEPLWGIDFDLADTQTTIAAGLALDPVAWTDETYRSAPDYRRELWEETGEGFDFEDPDQQASAASFPSEDSYWAPTDDQPNYLILVPVVEGWQVPAFLNYGLTNECPEPAVHVAMLRHWYEHYGAELVWMLGDSLYLRALRPPADLASARALAREQLVYCQSIEEASTIESLAGMLHRATVWYFWWD